MGTRAFSYQTPVLWSQLAGSVSVPETLSVFKDAFTPKQFGPFSTGQRSFPQIIHFICPGVKAHPNSGADQTIKLWVLLQVSHSVVRLQCEIQERERKWVCLRIYCCIHF